MPGIPTRVTLKTVNTSASLGGVGLRASTSISNKKIVKFRSRGPRKRSADLSEFEPGFCKVESFRSDDLPSLRPIGMARPRSGLRIEIGNLGRLLKAPQPDSRFRAANPRKLVKLDANRPLNGLTLIG